MGTYKLDPSTLALATYETPRRARSEKGPKETGDGEEVPGEVR
jgi:hypothetical protein